MMLSRRRVPKFATFLRGSYDSLPASASCSSIWKSLSLGTLGLHRSSMWRSLPLGTLGPRRLFSSSAGDIFVSEDFTHHVQNGRPLYEYLFDDVLSYHFPEGLAAVSWQGGAFHICTSGEPSYSSRFKRTFGFYQVTLILTLTLTP